MSETELSRAVEVVLRNGGEGLRRLLDASKTRGLEAEVSMAVVEAYGVERIAKATRDVSEAVHRGSVMGEGVDTRDCVLCNVGTQSLRAWWRDGHRRAELRRRGVDPDEQEALELVRQQIQRAQLGHPLACQRCQLTPGVLLAQSCEDHGHCQTCGRCLGA